MRTEAPERVLVLADLAEVEPVRIDVADVAELARSRAISFSFATPGWYSSRCPTISTRPLAAASSATAAASCRRLRERLLDEAVLAGAAATSIASARVRGNVGRDHDRVELRIRQQLAEVGRERACPGRRLPALRFSGRASQHQRSSQPSSAAKLRARFGPQ